MFKKDDKVKVVKGIKAFEGLTGTVLDTNGNQVKVKLNLSNDSELQKNLINVFEAYQLELESLDLLKEDNVSFDNDVEIEEPVNEKLSQEKLFKQAYDWYWNSEDLDGIDENDYRALFNHMKEKFTGLKNEYIEAILNDYNSIEDYENSKNVNEELMRDCQYREIEYVLQLDDGNGNKYYDGNSGVCNKESAKRYSSVDDAFAEAESASYKYIENAFNGSWEDGGWPADETIFFPEKILIKEWEQREIQTKDGSWREYDEYYGINANESLKLTESELKAWCSDHDANYYTQDIKDDKVIIRGLNEDLAEYNFKTKELKVFDYSGTTSAETKEDEDDDNYIRDYVYDIDMIDEKTEIPSWEFASVIATAEDTTEDAVVTEAHDRGFKVFLITASEYEKLVIASEKVKEEDIMEDFAAYLEGNPKVTEVI